MTAVLWLNKALQNIKTIHAYYVGEGVPDQAKKIISLIQNTVKQLHELPSLGRPGRVLGTRGLLVTKTPYLVIYREQKSEVHILRVLHSSQKWPVS